MSAFQLATGAHTVADHIKQEGNNSPNKMFMLCYI